MATMPLYAVWKNRQLPEEKLLRATALSFLVCMYISNPIPAVCPPCAAVLWLVGRAQPAGCAICAETIGRVISNMATGVTGMICDGGNQGCVTKGIAACDAAFSSVELAMDGVCVEALHGINGRTPEETMRNIGKVASPGMTETEKTIVEIQAQKAI